MKKIIKSTTRLLITINFLFFNAPLQLAQASNLTYFETQEETQYRTLDFDDFDCTTIIRPTDRISINISDLYLYSMTLIEFFEDNDNTLVIDISPRENEEDRNIFLVRDCIPRTLKHLAFSNKSNKPIALEYYFLSRLSNLISIDLHSLGNIEKINSYFLYRCSGITFLNLTPLRNINDTGFKFLWHCKNLDELDLRNSINLADAIKKLRRVLAGKVRLVINEVNLASWQAILPETAHQALVFQTREEEEKQKEQGEEEKEQDERLQYLIQLSRANVEITDKRQIPIVSLRSLH